MVTEIWQTEKDFKELLKVIDECGAKLVSFRGVPYENQDFGKLWLTDYFGSARIFYKEDKVPIVYGKTCHWVDDKSPCISFMIPILDNNIVFNGGLHLSKQYGKPHDERYLALYKKLSKYIKKNYKLSKKKWGYAGPDFLEEWKQHKLIASNGHPNPPGKPRVYTYKAEFDVE